MTKKAPPLAVRHVIWLCWKLVVLLSVALCALALLRLHSEPDLSSSSTSSYSRVRAPVSGGSFEGRPKIAFLFLARRNLPLDFLWDTFFEVFLPFFFIFIHIDVFYLFQRSRILFEFSYAFSGKWLFAECWRGELLDLYSLGAGVRVRWINIEVAFLSRPRIEE